MQQDYNKAPARGFEGMLADDGFRDAVSRSAAGILPFGRVAFEAGGNQAALAGARGAELVADADLITGNSTSGQVIVTAPDGTTTTSTVGPVVYATSHLATMNALAAAIDAVPGIASATVGGAGNRTISVVAAAGYTVALVGFVTTGGASQATWSASATVGGQVVAGVALHDYREPVSRGVSRFELGDPVGILKRGRVLVQAEQAVAKGDPVFVRIVAGGAGEEPGQVRKDADSGKAIALGAGFAFAEDTTGAGLVALSVNLPA